MSNLLNQFILIILFFSSFIGLSQNYTPLLNDLNEWHLTTCNGNGCTTRNYFTDGDTLVGGVEYKILDGFHFISRTFLIREDVMNRKVYLKILTSDITPNEYLLYDFYLSEGDIVPLFNPISPFPDEPGNFSLDSIRLKPLFDGDEYRHFYFSPIDPVLANSTKAVWVEGVGSLSLLNAAGGEPNYLNAGFLTCCFKDSELFYANLDSINECIPDYYLKTNEVKKVNLTVRPTLITEGCSIKSDMQIINVKVLALNGLIVVDHIVQHEFEFNVNMNFISSGVYFVRITLNNGSEKTIKVIKY